MGDVIFVVVVLAFFAIATLLVRACDHIIGPDGDAGATAAAAPLLGEDKSEVTAR